MEQARGVVGTCANSENDVARMNRVHAVLPIGGKTRVVTFGELEEFPGRETLVMTQSVGDFRALLKNIVTPTRMRKANRKKCPWAITGLATPSDGNTTAEWRSCPGTRATPAPN